MSGASSLRKQICLKIHLANLGDHGVKVHGHYSNRLEHTNFIVCEAETFEQLDAAFDPILEMGNFEVTPVMKRG